MSETLDTIPAPRCPQCEADGKLLSDALVDRSFSAPGTWGLRECAACELAWIDPLPAPSTLPALYDTYFTHTPDEPNGNGAKPGVVRRWLERGAVAALGHRVPGLSRGEGIAGHLLAAIRPLRELAQQSTMWLPPGVAGRLLDVGCGSGILMQRMEQLGWRVYGIENDPAGAAVARRSLGDEAIHTGSLDDAPFDEGSFDAITLSHVIEHLLAPEDALERCRQLLTPGGWMVVATPNLASLGRARFGLEWLHWDPPRHVRLYSPKSLSEMMEAAGFAIVDVSTPATSAYVIRNAAATLRARGRTDGLDFSGTSPLTKARALCFWAWESIACASGRRCGEDLVVLARRAATEDGSAGPATGGRP